MVTHAFRPARQPGTIVLVHSDPAGRRSSFAADASAAANNAEADWETDPGTDAAGGFGWRLLGRLLGLASASLTLAIAAWILSSAAA